ncbi:MAG: polyhydroxyalkanoate synthesis repressor PhaR [Rhodobacteraceae bacterium]|nr:polyhydroxyalkanoate synthesis repressor PhaR [Paracoccaceae bacterium]
MADPILINRYASRRLYNTRTSEYVTLEEIAALIREGHDVEIKDRKTGEDLTRQFLLQIITEQESKGENVLPVDVLTGLVRSYSTAAQSMLPDFLSHAWSAFSQQQSAMVEKISQMPSLPAQWQKQQAEIMRQMMAAWMPSATTAPKREAEQFDTEKELANVKAQLADLMRKVNEL